MSIQTITELLPGVSEVKAVSGGFQNLVYEAKLAGRKVIIRLSDNRNFDHLQAEEEWLDYLAANGCRVATAIQPITEIIHNGLPYYAVIFEHTNGRPVNVDDRNEWNEELFFKWGKMIALLHHNNIPELVRPIWLKDNELGQKVGNNPWLKEAFEKTIKTMCSFPRDELSFGLVHNDLHTGNFHLDGQNLILFDFDDCAYHFYAQDLAVSIYHALWTGNSYHPEWTDFPQVFLSTFFKGYRSLRQLTPDMYEHLIQCLKMREIFLFSLFKEKWDPGSLVAWQHSKLIDLEESIRSGSVPFEKEVSMQRGHFFAE